MTASITNSWKTDGSPFQTSDRTVIYFLSGTEGLDISGTKHKGNASSKDQIQPGWSKLAQLPLNSVGAVPIYTRAEFVSKSLMIDSRAISSPSTQKLVEGEKVTQ